MAKRKQTFDSTRRIPRQERARAKVEMILEAAARILEKEGRHALTTNRIAERAGVGVSTLYQYFASKEAILVAIARRELDRHRAAVIEAVTTAAAGQTNEPDRAALRALIAAFSSRRETRRIAFETLVAAELGHELTGPVEEVAAMLAGKRAAFFLPAALAPLRLFVLTRALSGVLSAAASEDARHLGTHEFEEELLTLLRAYAGANANATMTSPKMYRDH
jgi:AcrR family transcriptional regulator